ncbi:uncharacterized protein LOC131678527 [Topomyia yanbarensis]|uniref:uncharacterized protein LOC131678527 n=1 Tax=Topomyia yanbarensis TaxID=2498891 RepID=UPI00273A8B85|nr:uncharacterized protein LOC131678527 [Topomyia yanbarensis]
MSTSEDGESTAKDPSIATISEKFELLKVKFLAILEDRFFGNLKHDWRKEGCTSDQRDDSIPSYHSLSEESGSYLMLDGKKVSFEWFRLALAGVSQPEPEPTSVLVVPSVAEVPDLTYDNPYAVGTPAEMAALTQAKDRFHTHRTRGREGMRKRLLVEDVPFDKETLGVKHKHPSMLATQLDAHYWSETTYRPRIRNFMRVDAIHKLRDDSRRQFETCYRKEYLFEKTEVEKAEKQYHKDLHERSAELLQAIRVIRQQRFSSSMRVLDKVKPCYEETVRLEAKYRDCQRQMVGLWNQVIRLESIWFRRLKYQNFLYLIMPKQWREEHDWIHKNEEGKLEGYPESISKRDVVNLRNLDGTNDIWAVKEFFEKEYLEKDKPLHPAFEDSASLMEGVAELDVNSMTLLSRLNLLSWVKVGAEKEAHKVNVFYEKTIQNLRYSIEDLVQRTDRCEERSKRLKHMFNDLAQEPLRACVENEQTRSIETLLYVLYKQLLPPDQRENALRFSGTESFMYIFDVFTQMLADFDKIPPKLLHSVEKKVRFQRKQKLRAAQRAAELDHRHNLVAIQLQRSLAPPYVRPPRTGKLPRSRLKKKPVPVVVVPPVVTKLDKIFCTAFGENVTMTSAERRNLEMDMTFRNYCAIQYDHFLRTLGYEPEYDFETEVQLRDGPEIDRFKRIELVPKVMQRMAKWDALQETLKQRLLARISETDT